jgi:hypothetical protein
MVPVTLFLGDSVAAVVGRIDRTANRNATPRIFGNKPLNLEGAFETSISSEIQSVPAARPVWWQRTSFLSGVALDVRSFGSKADASLTPVGLRED